MGKLIEKTGDLFSTDAPAVGHGVNIRGDMSGGIAVAFKNRFPKMFDCYESICGNELLMPGETYVWWDEFRQVWVYNIASQDEPGPHARLDWFKEALVEAVESAEENGVDRIAIPRIGCGIGGLEWDDVKASVQEVLEDTDVDIEVWTLE